jgi:hypothetical protein
MGRFFYPYIVLLGIDVKYELQSLDIHNRGTPRRFSSKRKNFSQHITRVQVKPPWKSYNSYSMGVYCLQYISPTFQIFDYLQSDTGPTDTDVFSPPCSDYSILTSILSLDSFLLFSFRKQDTTQPCHNVLYGEMASIRFNLD